MCDAKYANVVLCDRKSGELEVAIAIDKPKRETKQQKCLVGE